MASEVPPHIAKHLSSSMSKTIVESFIGAAASVAPHLAEHASKERDKLAVRINDSLRPYLELLLGGSLAREPGDHAIKLMWDDPIPGGTPDAGGAGSAGEGCPTGVPLWPSGGIAPTVLQGGKPSADPIVEAILTILGIIGAAFGILPALGSIETRGFIQGFNASHANAVLSPEALADMVEREILCEDDAAVEASMSGINSDRFHNLVLDTGEPPGLEQMLGLWRRGSLDTPTLRRMIAYSRVRTEWTQHVLQLAWDTMPQADAIEAVLKGILPDATGRALWQAAGGLASQNLEDTLSGEQVAGADVVAGVDQFAVLLAASGNPIGVEAALRLYNHGKITEAAARQVIRHSRINPQFEDMAFLLHNQWLSVFQVEQALKGGTVTKEQATQWLLDDGYQHDQVAAFVSGVTAQKVSKHKDESAATVETLYAVGWITKEAAVQSLGQLGYDVSEAGFMLEVAYARKIEAQRQVVVSKVRNAFLLGKLTDDAARKDLSALDVPGDAITGYIEAWAVERQTEVKTLTMAQVGGMVKKGFISIEAAMKRWEAMGYDAEDQLLLVAEYTGVAPPGSPAASHKG